MCAYNPGVTDISGQLRAQGMMAGSQSLAQGIGNAFQEYKANEEKRRLASSAFNGALAADTTGTLYSSLQKDPEAAKLLAKRQAGKSTASDEMYLAGMVTSMSKRREEEQAQKLREMQMAQTQATIEHTKALIPNLANENQLLKARIDELTGKTEQDKRDAEQKATNLRALRTANSPTAGLADQISGGSGFEQLDPNKAPDRASMFMRQGGYDPQMLNQLLDQQKFDDQRNAPRPRPGVNRLGTDSYGRPVEEVVGSDGKVHPLAQPSGTQLEVNKDGTISFRQGTAGSMTNSSQTDAQKNQFNYERIYAQGDALKNKLTDADVGVQGNVNELINSTVGQVNPNLIKEQVAKNRTELAMFREGALRSISGDTRFSNADRAALEKIMAGSGWLESAPAARAKITTVQEILRERAGMESGRQGKTSILYETPENIVKAAKDGKVPPEMAAQLLSSLHPEWVAEQKKKRQ